MHNIVKNLCFFHKLYGLWMEVKTIYVSLFNNIYWQLIEVRLAVVEEQGNSSEALIGIG